MNALSTHLHQNQAENGRTIASVGPLRLLAAEKYRKAGANREDMMKRALCQLRAAGANRQITVVALSGNVHAAVPLKIQK